MTITRIRVLLLTSAWVWCPTLALAAVAPLAVSPGSATGTSIGDACPTFSWAPVEGASAYELIVYRLGDEEEPEAEPLLRKRIPGAALSWTPSLTSCFEPGGRYAWSVRSLGSRGVSMWSAPSLFQVASGPSQADLEEALSVIRRFLAAEPDTGVPRGAAFGPLAELAIRETEEESPTRSSISVGNPTARLTLDGEVRTLDPGGASRLWGRGRPNTLVYNQIEGSEDTCVNGSTNFGLSKHAVDWGSAADACPAGTWVCRSTETIACDTNRPDFSFDMILCDGTTHNDLPSIHRGWVADASPFTTTGTSDSGLVKSEEGVTGPPATCRTRAVWCCWERLP